MHHVWGWWWSSRQLCNLHPGGVHQGLRWSSGGAWRNSKFFHPLWVDFKASRRKMHWTQSVAWSWHKVPSSAVVCPRLPQLVILWKGEKTNSTSFLGFVVAPKCCTIHHSSFSIRFNNRNVFISKQIFVFPYANFSINHQLSQYQEVGNLWRQQVLCLVMRWNFCIICGLTSDQYK